MLVSSAVFLRASSLPDDMRVSAEKGPCPWISVTREVSCLWDAAMCGLNEQDSNKHLPARDGGEGPSGGGGTGGGGMHGSRCPGA